VGKKKLILLQRYTVSEHPHATHAGKYHQHWWKGISGPMRKVFYCNLP